MVGAARELRELVKGFDEDQLREFCAEKGIEWKFTTPASPHQNGCVEALVKTCKKVLSKGPLGSKFWRHYNCTRVCLRSRIWLTSALSEEFQMTQMTGPTSALTTSC